MRFKAFEWDRHNLRHIGRHQVTAEEAEQACWHHPLSLKGRLPRYYVLGQTENGRYLNVIVEIKPFGVARVVTARDMGAAERKRYLRR